jgi:hypothetical protein
VALAGSLRYKTAFSEQKKIHLAEPNLANFFLRNGKISSTTVNSSREHSPAENRRLCLGVGAKEQRLKA